MVYLYFFTLNFLVTDILNKATANSSALDFSLYADWPNVIYVNIIYWFVDVVVL